MLKARTNSESEDFKKKINQRMLQNRKLDELYGRKPRKLKQEIEQAIHDISKNSQDPA